MTLMFLSLLLTSIGAVFLGTRYFGLSLGSLSYAFGTFAECLGLALFFLLLNVTTAAAIVVVNRMVGVGFMSAYALGDVTFLFFSLTQAIVVQLWRLSSVATSSND